MALKKYESKARLIPAGEMTDVVNRQALSSSQDLSNKLDKLASYFYEELRQDAVTEGQLYGVKNAPTLAQITDAIANNQDVNSYFAEGGSYYGDAARKVQADLLRQDSVSAYLDKAETIKIGLDNKAISLDEVDSLVNSLQAEIDGTYDVIASIDPEAALKYNAQASKIGYDVFQKANATAAKAAYDLKVEGIKQFETNYKSQLEDKLKTTNDPYQAFYALQDIRNDVVASYGMLSDGALRSMKLTDEENKVLEDWIASTLAKQGNVIDWLDGKITDYDFILEMRGIQGRKDEIASAALKKEKEITDAIDSQQKQKLARNAEKIEQNEIDYFGGGTNLSPQAFIQQQSALGKFYTVAQKEKLNKVNDNIEPTTKQTQNFATAKQVVALGLQGKEYLQDMLDKDEITLKQWSTLTDDYIKKSEQYSIGVNEIKLQLNVSEGEIPSDDNKLKMARLSNAIVRFNTEMRRRQQAGEPLNQIEYAREVTKEARIEILQEEVDGLLSSIEKNLQGRMPDVEESIEELSKKSKNARIKLYESKGYKITDYRLLESRLAEYLLLSKELNNGK